ncbi:hypothetical protein DFA_07379 [Cavenderia fasciculata]|uniref:Phytanoyl-CoA dioxygenase n=1 Tax=Cavenderia fasciculata TaxID=261658 RepID=F4PW92_CACFS|nr:uncharacterized protein DFA_07379 [Cavenderia fasciculata]EGG20256.1 hypothetical protein DFA_07379 [Cavenderia fasciculata]|eukprot:XP_004367239.1 hypothetical protein DFA_07379 [Cavenderia fasciculata]
MKLTKEQLKQYKEDGFLIIPDFVPHNEIDQIVTEMKRLVDNVDLPDTIQSIFTTNEQERKTNDYFMNSAGTISFFFESDAIKNGELVVDRDVAFNKVGHALHDLNPVFEKFSYHPRIKELVYSLEIFNKALSVQSMYIFKNKTTGGEVGIHQDSTFLHTTPLTTHALWFALEDATIENGCLRGLEGSHKHGIKRRFVRKEKGSNEMTFVGEDDKYKKEDFAALECKKGSVILLDGSVVHYSEPNKSAKSRHAYTLHFIEGDGSAVYEQENWLQRSSSQQPFREL